MIQRIQTVYLLLVSILLGITLFAPLAWFGIGNEIYMLRAFSVESPAGQTVQSPAFWTGILLACSAVLPVLTIFLYKRRMLQIRLCAVEFVLLVGCVAMLACSYFGHGEVDAQGMKPAIFLPVVAMLLVFLAGRAIFRDEILVKSLDRIR